MTFQRSVKFELAEVKILAFQNVIRKELIYLIDVELFLKQNRTLLLKERNKIMVFGKYQRIRVQSRARDKT